MLTTMSRRTRSCKSRRYKHHGAEERSIADILQDVFPLKIDKDDVELIQDPVKDVNGLNSREITFNGVYKNVEISCVCVLTFGDVQYHHKQYYYGYKMSEKLLACRNMANYFGMFEADVMEMADFFVTPPKDLALFIVKPSFTHGTVSEYLKTLRKSGGNITPLNMIQMGITLFSTLTDAHIQKIGLVDITLESLYVSLDLGLYFDGFQSCVRLHKGLPVFNKFWMNSRTIKCPEASSLKSGKYSLSVDVFLAGVVLLELTKSPECKCKKLYTHDRAANRIQVIEEYVDDSHKKVIPIIEKCISLVPGDRPKASEVLYWLETLRQQSFAAADNE